MNRKIKELEQELDEAKQHIVVLHSVIDEVTDAAWGIQDWGNTHFGKVLDKMGSIVIDYVSTRKV